MEKCNEHGIDWPSHRYRICPVCYYTQGSQSGQEGSTNERALDDKIAELEGRAKEIIIAREERLLEKTGDHGRPDHGGTNGGMRWL